MMELARIQLTEVTPCAAGRISAASVKVSAEVDPSNPTSQAVSDGRTGDGRAGRHLLATWISYIYPARRRLHAKLF